MGLFDNSGSSPLALNSTLADERANSYVTLDDLKAYWGDHFDQTTGASLLALSDTQLTLLLVRSCRTLDGLHFTEAVDPLADYHLMYDTRTQQIRSVKTNFGRPQKYNYYQHLQFPRTIDVFEDGTLFVPAEIMVAQCEQAAYELTFDPSILSNSLQGVDRDSLNVNGIALSQHYRSKGSMISPVAYNLAKPYLISSTMRLYRA